MAQPETGYERQNESVRPRRETVSERTVRDDRHTPTAATTKRISWGAIFAGAVIALVVQLTLNMLGLSIGLGVIDPATESNPLNGLGTGTGIWIVVSGIISLFVGGWAAGRLAGLPRRVDGVLHGIVAWAVTMAATLFLVATSVGTVLSGAFTVVQEGSQLVGQGIEAVAPELGNAASDMGDEISTEAIWSEAEAILRQTGREELEPENLAQRGEQMADNAQQAVGDAAQTPSEARDEIESAFERLITSGENVAEEIDREAAVNVLMSRTDMTRQEAQQTVEEYESVFQQALEQIGQTAETVGEQAVEASDEVIAVISSAALWAFFSLVIGAIAAGAGGAAGAPAHSRPAYDRGRATRRSDR